MCRAPRAQDWLTLITDGAAQKWYVVPRSAGTDLGRQALQLKLVGTLVHSHGLARGAMAMALMRQNSVTLRHYAVVVRCLLGR